MQPRLYWEKIKTVKVFTAHRLNFPPYRLKIRPRFGCSNFWTARRLNFRTFSVGPCERETPICTNFKPVENSSGATVWIRPEEKNNSKPPLRWVFAQTNRSCFQLIAVWLSFQRVSAGIPQAPCVVSTISKQDFDYLQPRSQAFQQGGRGEGGAHPCHNNSLI